MYIYYNFKPSTSNNYENQIVLYIKHLSLKIKITSLILKI